MAPASIASRLISKVCAGAHRGVLAGMLSCLALPMASAQTRVAEISLYQGADRQEVPLKGAKQEGQLTLYSNAPTEDNTALVGAFERAYGIKVQLWRAGS